MLCFVLINSVLLNLLCVWFPSVDAPCLLTSTISANVFAEVLYSRPKFYIPGRHLNLPRTDSAMAVWVATQLSLQCYFTSTEARWLIRDPLQSGKGTKEWRPRPRIPPPAELKDRRHRGPPTMRTTEVLRRCLLAIAQPPRLVHCAVAVSTAVLGLSQRQYPLHCVLTNNLDNSKQTLTVHL